METLWDDTRKAKFQLEFNLTRDVKENKSFYMSLGNNKKARKMVSLVLNESGDSVTQDMEKAEGECILCFNLYNKTILLESQITET